MILYNPNPDKTKSNVCTAFMVIIPIILIAAAITESILMVKNLFPTQGDAIWFYLFASYAAYIVIGIISILLLKRKEDKYRNEVNLGGIGIAFCECGYFFNLSDISYRLDENSVKTKYNENDSGTSSSSETSGTILIECTCKNCGKQANSSIRVVLGSSSESYKRKWLTTDYGTTYEHKRSSNITSNDEIEEKIKQKYYSDRSNAEKMLEYYKKLGYRKTDERGNTSADWQSQRQYPDLGSYTVEQLREQLANESDEELRYLIEMEIEDRLDEENNAPHKG